MKSFSIYAAGIIKLTDNVSGFTVKDSEVKKLAAIYSKQW